MYKRQGYIYPVEVKIGDVTENLGATAFNNLDPSVIESISVLKDAAAAVYLSLIHISCCQWCNIGYYQER